MMFGNKKSLFLISYVVLVVAILGGCSEIVKTRAFTYKQPIIDPDIYVDIYNPDLAWNGSTLLADNHNLEHPRIIEVNMRGEIVWQYAIPNKIVRDSHPGRGLDVELLSNNNILFVLPFEGVYEVNRQGMIVWSYRDRVTHDADRLPNGNTIMVCSWGKISDAQVKEVNSKGKVVWEWYTKDHFYKPPYKDISDAGWTHVNAVSRHSNGNTLVSLRNFDLTVEVDAQGSVIWSFSWKSLGKGPHEPEILPNGNMLIALRKPHRVMEINRETEAIVWEYRKSGLKTIRDADRLPNGNTLIVGRTEILEVTRDGEVVWQLGVKGVSRENKDKGRWFYKAERIAIKGNK